MTSPPRQIVIDCPGCHAVYETLWRPSMNLSVDDFSEEYMAEMSSGTCPHCRLVVTLETLVVDEDGTLRALNRKLVLMAGY